MVRDGVEFPAVVWEDELVPEAVSYEHLKELPHQVVDAHARFPRAIAAAALGDEDAGDHDDLERRGVELGRKGLA